MNYILCALAYVATIVAIVYGFSKLRRTCPVCEGKGVGVSGTLCNACNGEGKL
jgi:DnaJ-class molecular chaperone